MTRTPRQPLDAEERALAAHLPRPHGRDAPGADIDARILAAAHAAGASPQTVATRRRRWIVPAGVAASLCLALGLAWRVQLAPPDRAAEATNRDVKQAPATPVEKPSPASPQTVITAPQAQPTPAAVPVPAPGATTPRLPAADTASMINEMPRMPASPPPPAGIAPTPVSAFPDSPAAAIPAPPSPPAAPPPVAAAVAPHAQVTEPITPPPARAATVPAPAMAIASKARARQRSAVAQEAAASDAPDADIPPATADAPEVREAWLRRIAQLQREGSTAEARASLAEFRRRYPDLVLPAELRALETPAKEPAPQ